MWFWRIPHNPTAYDDDFEGQPSQSWWHKWMLGVVVPLGLIGLGLWMCITQEITTIGRNQTTFRGSNAFALGCAAVSIGWFLHFHYFWGNIYDQAWFAVLGKFVALIAMIASLGFLIVHAGVLGRN